MKRVRPLIAAFCLASGAVVLPVVGTGAPSAGPPDPVAVDTPTHPAGTRVNGKAKSQVTDPADRALLAAFENAAALRQGASVKAAGHTIHVTGVRNVANAQTTMDPGCDVTSSNPGSYDLCGATSWPDGDTVSAWTTDTYAKCWTGMQERDSDDRWRAWAKCQMIYNNKHVSAYWNIGDFSAWTSEGGWAILGSLDFDEICGPCYWTGTAWRVKAIGSGRNAVTMWRFETFYTVTYQSQTRNCVFSYAFDWGSGRSYDPALSDCTP